MLRKFSPASALTLALLLGAASAAQADNDIGCGIGTILWEGQSGVIAKTLAATTNGSTGSQTLGVSSGTSECQQGGVITVAARLPVYASANLDRLAADMAAGEGETLTNLAVLYDIAPEDQADFLTLTRANFARLFPSEDTSAEQMLATLERLMAQAPELAGYVAG